MKKRILISDDDPTIREILAELFLCEGCEVRAVGRNNDVLREVKQSGPYDVIILDYNQVPNGIDLTKELRKIFFTPKIYISTGNCVDDVFWDSIGAGAAGFFGKPTRLESYLCVIGEHDGILVSWVPYSIQNPRILMQDKERIVFEDGKARKFTVLKIQTDCVKMMIQKCESGISK